MDFRETEEQVALRKAVAELGRRFGNAVLAASHRPLDTAALTRLTASDAFPARVEHGQGVRDFIRGARPVRDEDAVRGLDMYRKHANVVVLRTFSKAHGLANLRVGYSVSRPEITKALRTVATPFAVSTVAEEAAIASLEHLDEVLRDSAEHFGWSARLVATVRLSLQVVQSWQ